MPRPDWEGVERFTPLPGEGGAPPEWRNVRHGLNSMDLLVDQKLGGRNPQGEVEWITNEQLLLQLSDRNTLRIRWNISEGEMERFGLTDPRVRLTIWRW
jgi:hypothetical protein